MMRPVRGRQPGRTLPALLLALCICACCFTHARSSRLLLAETRQSSGDPAYLHGAELRGQPTAQAPGLEIVARQQLFDFATSQGLSILTSRVQQIAIPDVTKSFNLPLVGDFTLQLSNLRVASFNVSAEEARLQILLDRFALMVTQVQAQLTFDWHWEKLGMSGSGNGELLLEGGDIDYLFRIVTSADTGRPHLEVDAANSRFSAVALTIHSFSADWLYQAVLSLFNDQIQKAVQNGINDALHSDVPDAINKVLASLPTKLQIQGLPFSTSFEYSIFTLTYVLVKGYGEVESDQPAVDTPRSQAAAAAKPLAGGAAGQAASGVLPAAAATHTAAEGQADGSHSVQRRGLSSASSSVGDQASCPFSATPLPLTADELAGDSHMISLYFHESMANCLLWGLHRSGSLKFDLHDGVIDKLHLTTDLLAMLIPALPKTYPHMLVQVLVEAVTAPVVSFAAGTGSQLQASYRTTIVVANDTLGNPRIATLVANLTIGGQFNWDSTIIMSVAAQHAVEESVMAVPTAAWDRTVAWFVQNYAGLYPLNFLVEKFVHTPVTSLVGLINGQASTWEGWFGLSGDVRVMAEAPRQL